MIPLSDVTAEVIKKNMLVTTRPEVLLLIVATLLIVSAYWLCIVMIVEHKYVNFLKENGLEARYTAWRKKRKEMIEKYS